MPYFIDRDSRTVIVKSPGKNPMPREAVVDGETAAACNLTHGQVLTNQQMGYLLDGSISAFNASIASSAATQRPQDGSFNRPAGMPADSPARPTTHWSEELRAGSSHQSAAASRAHSVAATVEALSWIFLILSVIVGIAVAAQTEDNGFGETIHPHIVEGIVIAIAGSFQALVVIMFASYIAYRTQEPPAAPR